MNPIERYCFDRGIGLDLKHLEALRSLFKGNKIEERVLSTGGYSYFPKGAKSKGRIFKIAVVKERLFIEFNIDVIKAKEIKDIIWLSDADRIALHAGGVKFCYIGSDYVEAERLIKEVIKGIYWLYY